jgi:hypothetical protein
MSLTILKRIDIDINTYFTALSVGFTIHKRGLQLSLFFFDIDIYYLITSARKLSEERYKNLRKLLDEEDDQA